MLHCDANATANGQQACDSLRPSSKPRTEVCAIGPTDQTESIFGDQATNGFLDSQQLRQRKAHRLGSNRCPEDPNRFASIAFPSLQRMTARWPTSSCCRQGSLLAERPMDVRFRQVGLPKSCDWFSSDPVEVRSVIAAHNAGVGGTISEAGLHALCNGPGDRSEVSARGPTGRYCQ
jgi:hypothetical protein